MKKKPRVKVGGSIRVITGKYRNGCFTVRKIDKRKNFVFLEHVSRVVFVMNRREGRRQGKELFSSVHISNVKPVK